VLAAAALEDQADINGVLAVLVPVEDGAAGAEVVAAVAAGDAIDGVLPQVAFRRGLDDGVAGEFLQFELVETSWRLDVEGDGAGVLANGGAALLGQGDVGGD